MKTITDDIRQAIKKHLPEMQADELKKFIEQAQKDSESVERLTQQLASKEEQVNKLSAQKSDFDNASKLLHDAKLSASITEQKERGMEVEKLKIQLAAEVRITGNMREFISLIAKNPRAIEIMQHTESISQPPYYAGNQMVYPPSQLKDERKISETVSTKEASRMEPVI